MIRTGLFSFFLSLLAPLSSHAAGLVFAPGHLLLDAEERVAPEGDPSYAPIVFKLRAGDPLFPVTAPLAAGDLEETSAWQVQIFDSRDQKVSFIQGREQAPPERIAWSGLSETGQPLPDGFYKARFVWMDKGGQYHKTPHVRLSLLRMPQLMHFIDPHIELSYDQEGLVIRMAEKVVFTSAKWEIEQRARPVLAKIAAFLKKYPKNRLRVLGHTDSTGAPEFNKYLSRKRAWAVYQYLIGREIDPDRLSYEGAASTKPIASDLTQDGRAKNRRVEIVVLKKTI